MRRLSPFALAIPADGPEPHPASLALIAAIAQGGRRVQHYRCRARPYPSQVIEQVTGLPGRHLDHWLMPAGLSLEVLKRGLRHADVVIVEGTLESPPRRCSRAYYAGPGPLGPLRECLGIPVVGVMPCPDSEQCHLDRRPVGVDAILLDGLTDPSRYASIKTFVEMATRIPVIGAVGALPRARAELLAAGHHGPVREEVIEALAQSFLAHADFEALYALCPTAKLDRNTGPLILTGRERRRFRVAFAMDEAFGGYDPDTLESLESLGAELLEFSPLYDEALPPGVDLVLIGCGTPERHAAELAANLSLISTLKQHVCRGLRILAEGGGAAYLARFLYVGDECQPGAGILPMDAVLRRRPGEPVPVERTIAQNCWLGQRGTRLRGYRTGRWNFQPAPDPGDCPTRSGFLNPQRDICFRHHAIGSLIHLHLGALPEVVRAFAGPHRPSLSIPLRTDVPGPPIV